MPTRTHNADGTFGVDARARHAEAARLHDLGLSYRQIASELGYGSVSGAFDAVQRIVQGVPAPAQPAETKRRSALTRRQRSMYELAEAHATDWEDAAAAGDVWRASRAAERVVQALLDARRARVERDGLQRGGGQ